MRHIARLAAAQLHASCALMLRSGGQLYTAASSDPRAEAMSDWQFSHGTGPSLEAMDDNVAVYSVASAKSHWPGFSRLAAEQRFTSSMSVPLLTEATTIGALTAYRDIPQHFAPADQQVAQQFAGRAAGAVAYLLRIANRPDLSTALAQQSVIDTAVGILMVRAGHDGDQALAALSADADARGLQLSQAALELVTATSGR
ncbi:MAG: GAF domain-containing protein [Jatrophihabitantaceae bacterium]